MMEYKKKVFNIYKIFNISYLLFMLSSPALALKPYAGAWFGINYQNYISKDQKWVFLIHNQIRFLSTDHPLETILNEDSIGYGINSRHRIWLGYYLAEHRPYNHDYKEHRLWQQYYWKIEENDKEKVASRTRFEEMKFSRLSPNLIVFRQLLALETSIFHLGPVKPLFYEEIFMRLNHPEYATTSFFSQNRLFLGANIYCHNGGFWKVGYMNQFENNTPRLSRAMTHIFTANYTFGEREISLPVDS